MTENFQTNSPRTPRSRLQGPLHSQNVDPNSLPLNHHPQWHPFLHLLEKALLTRYPDFRPQFLELLSQADQFHSK